MRAKGSFLGILEDYAGVASIEVQLEDGSTVGDLLCQIGRRVGQNFPASIWDPEKEAFTPLVMVFVDSADVEELSQPLPDGSEVLLLMPAPGG